MFQSSGVALASTNVLKNLIILDLLDKSYTYLPKSGGTYKLPPTLGGLVGVM